MSFNVRCGRGWDSCHGCLAQLPYVMNRMSGTKHDLKITTPRTPLIGDDGRWAYHFYLP
ncbi:MAG TPA: hypothetical protein VKY92_16775 [Verrucomicrobiae bacterium]|jgi:hypothetical protein|nr:hypothetical protein [Verrucomicrobiae bacterium]